MSDLIDRQAILKHIEKIRQQSVQFMDDTRRASIIMNGMYLCEKAVMNQPSAQPDLQPTCNQLATDCISRQAAIELIERMKPYHQDADDIAEMIANMPSAQFEQRWIPCSERLPDIEKDVMFVVDGLSVAVGCLKAYGDWRQYNEGRWAVAYPKEQVIAWMPLPEPYREDGGTG